MYEYKRAIVDELGDILYWCSQLTNEEIDDILTNHPEWRECLIAI